MHAVIIIFLTLISASRRFMVNADFQFLIYLLTYQHLDLSTLKDGKFLKSTGTFMVPDETRNLAIEPLGFPQVPQSFRLCTSVPQEPLIFI
jgi:hypothetical protein